MAALWRVYNIHIVVGLFIAILSLGVAVWSERVY